MIVNRTLFALSIAVVLATVGGCGSKEPDNVTNSPGPPKGPQPAAGAATTDNNAVTSNAVR